MPTSHIIGKYQATPPTLTDGQTTQVRVTSTGALVTDGAGTISSIVPGIDATNLGKADDKVHASGDTGVMFLAVANEAQSNLSGTDGDYTPIGTNRKGTVYNQETMVDQFVDTRMELPLSVSSLSQARPTRLQPSRTGALTRH